MDTRAVRTGNPDPGSGCRTVQKPRRTTRAQRCIPPEIAAGLLHALRSLPLFEGLDPAVLNRLVVHCALERYEKHRDMLCAVDEDSYFRFLVAGSAKLQLETLDGRKKVVEILGPGYNFDECLPLQVPMQNLRLISLGVSQVLRISKPVVLDELQAYPPLALRLISSMSRRMGQLLVELNSHMFDTAMQRFVRYLTTQLISLESAKKQFAVTVTLPVGKAVVASRLSLSPEYFSRMLRQLESEQLIAVDNRTISIPDVSRLIATYGPQSA